MRRIVIFLVFLPAAMLVAGLFGAFHDQIGYSVSSEYFTRFKFIQFRLLDTDLPERIRVAEVGFRASWWMGIPLGIFCGSAGFLQRSPAQMLGGALSIPAAWLFHIVFRARVATMGMNSSPRD